jgi:hypothetical protein
MKSFPRLASQYWLPFNEFFVALLAMVLSGCATLESKPSVEVRAPPAANRASPPETPSPHNTFSDDTLVLIGLLEGWRTTQVPEIQDRMAHLFFEQIRATFPDVPEAEWRVLLPEYEPRIASLCRARFATVLLKHFSHEELRQMIRFYTTPVGAAYAGAYPEIIKELSGRDPLRDALMHEIVTRVRMKQLERSASIVE